MDGLATAMPIEEVVSVLGRWSGTTSSLSDAELVSALTSLCRLQASVAGLRLEAVAEFDRRGLARSLGARDTGTYLAATAGDRPGSARRDVELAAAVDPLPAVASALTGGQLSLAKAAELVVGAELDAEVLAALVVRAPAMSVSEVGRAVRRAQLDAGIDLAERGSSCEIRRSASRVVVSADLDLVEGEIIETALDAMAETLGLPKDQPYVQRRAAALVALARHYLDHASEVPSGRLGRPHVVVVVDLDVLEARTHGHARLLSGAVITGAQARQLADDACISRVIVRGPSKVLDVGRATRTVSPAQAKAVIVRDRHCRWAGCDAPPRACEVHHRQPWSWGGRTDLDNLGLLCWFHHKHVHRSGPENLVEDPHGRWKLAERGSVAA